MITKIKINGFKTFQNFQMEFTPFTVIAGINSSGKSNLFDAMQLLSMISDHNLSEAFNTERGRAKELFTKFNDDSYSEKMEFEVEILLNKSISDSWGKTNTLKYTRLRYCLVIEHGKNDMGLGELYVAEEKLEPIRHNDDLWIRNHISKGFIEYWRPKLVTGKRGVAYIETINGSIILRQDSHGGNKKEFPAGKITQTILSGLNSVDFVHAFAVKEEMRSWKFLQLDPNALRMPTKQDIGSRDVITQNGDNLAAALYRMKLKDITVLTDISRTINNLLSNVTEVDVVDDKANKQYVLKIKNEDLHEFTSLVLSEGTLRLIALCVMQYDNRHTGLLCFEEPENGIHPGRMHEMVKLLLGLSNNFEEKEQPLRQIIINTHSPILVNEVISMDDLSKVKVWFFLLITSIVEINGVKTKLHITKNIPVISNYVTDLNGKLTMNFQENERKMVLNELFQYLQSTDIDKTIKEMSRR